MASWELAQLNVATLLAPIDSPELAGFVAELERINALADDAPGFVWRFASDVTDPDAEPTPFGDDVIVNYSVWASVEALHDYVYRSGHVEVMRRRKEWFHRMRDAHSVLWWVPRGHRPTMTEVHARLERLRRDGPGPAAFTFKTVHAAPGADDPAPRVPDVDCPAY